MFASYAKIVLRSIRRHPVFAVVSISSLAIGFAAFLVIAVFIQDERSYDRMHDGADRTFRLVREFAAGLRPNTPAPVGPLLRAEYPEVRSQTRVFRYWHDPLVGRGEHGFIEDNLLFADSTFFDVFEFPLRRGASEDALVRPGSIVLTPGLARKYFGEEDPIGKTVSYNVEHVLTVTGVLEELPRNVHFRPDGLISISTLPDVAFPSILEHWGMNAFKTYVLLEEGVTAGAFEARSAAFFARHRDDTVSVMQLQPLTSIHLHSNLRDELEDNGDAGFLVLLATIGFLIVGIAGINYMNLATARAAGRAVEVGLRKTSGADRSQLRRQFLGESLLFSVTAGIMAVVLAAAFIPILNRITEKAASLWTMTWSGALLFVGMVLISGMVAGAYPAVVSARFSPADALKGGFMRITGAVSIRKGLVVIQFVASIVLIVGTIIIARQLEFLKTTDIGFAREQILAIPIEDAAMRRQVESMSSALEGHPAILSVGSTNQYPGEPHASSSAVWEGAGTDEEVAMSATWLYDNYFETMGIEVAAGRVLDRARRGDIDNAVAVNEAAVRAIGWTNEEALGKWITCGVDNRERMEIVGVVRDFHFTSLHTPIEPMIFYLDEESPRNLVVRVDLDNVAGAIDHLRGRWAEFAGSQPFIYQFVDAEFNRQYIREERWGVLMGWASATAILIACLGLFGLAAYSVLQRTKEIGVRKVLGASVSGIVQLLMQDVVRLVALAFVIGAPLAWLAATRWLESFAYRTHIGPGVFVQAGVAILILSTATVAWLALRAATADPVESLRYE